MNLPTRLYADQATKWPALGRHILAHHDAETIVVYQAYRPEIGHYVLQHGAFGGEFSYARMSWVKPNFLWMMYRSGWGQKEGQEVTLALRIRRGFFDRLLSLAISSSFDARAYPNHAAWKKAVETSEVRLQWDPDHGPNGEPMARRAIQLGLRGEVLAEFGRRELLDVIDMSPFVAEQRAVLAAKGAASIMTPEERVYRSFED